MWRKTQNPAGPQLAAGNDSASVAAGTHYKTRAGSNRPLGCVWDSVLLARSQVGADRHVDIVLPNAPADRPGLRSAQIAVLKSSTPTPLQTGSVSSLRNSPCCGLLPQRPLQTGSSDQRNCRTGHLLLSPTCRTQGIGLLIKFTTNKCDGLIFYSEFQLFPVRQLRAHL